MKHILIPTDFTVASLQPVHHIVKHYRSDKQLRITLLHLLEPPSGIQDIFTRWTNIGLSDNISEEFSSACEILQNKYSSNIQRLEIVIKHGNTQAYLKNLLEGYNVDAIWIAESFSFCLPCKQSVDLYRLIQKSRLPVKQAPSQSTPISVGNTLSELLVTESFEMNIA